MSKRVGWLILIIGLCLVTLRVIVQINHNMSKKKSIQEEIKIINSLFGACCSVVYCCWLRVLT